MRGGFNRTPVWSVGLLLALWLLVPSAPHAADQVLRTAVRTVYVHATVTNVGGRLEPNLTQADFEVLDNGERQAITVFEAGRVPITVAMMFDTSGSMREIISVLREGARHFVDSLRPDDRAVIGSFGDEIAISPHLTGDRAVLHRVLDQELWPGGPTPLWKAIDVAMNALDGETGRRVVLVFTDGGNNTRLFRGEADDVTSASLLRRTRDEEFMVYVIRPRRDPGRRGLRDFYDPLLDLVRESGGGFLDVDEDLRDIGSAFSRVAEELQHQYLIGFSPKVLDGKVHRLQVRVLRGGLRARARTSYTASPE
jgi:Ca-activated chloride channel homolog